MTGSQKYRNYAELVQGVSQVKAGLSQGERLFVLTLAAFNTKNDPHPGNEKLACACGIKSRKGVNYIANKLVQKRLIKILEVGNGRGKATVYRIRVEDERFPSPKMRQKPGSSDFPVSDGGLDAKPGSNNFPVTENGNPEVSVPETRKSELPHELNPRGGGVFLLENDSSVVAVTGKDEAAAFAILGYDKPIGNRKFRQAWARKFKNKKPGVWLTEYMEEFIQECEPDGIKVPGFFYEVKREVEKVELSYAKAGQKTPYDSPEFSERIS